MHVNLCMSLGVVNRFFPSSLMKCNEMQLSIALKKNLQSLMPMHHGARMSTADCILLD